VKIPQFIYSIFTSQTNRFLSYR